MSHVDDIKVIKMNVKRIQILHAYVADAINSSEIFYTLITKIKYTAVHAHKMSLEWNVTFCFCVISSRIRNTHAMCYTEGTSMLVQLGPEHEINLRSAPYELVPGSFV